MATLHDSKPVLLLTTGATGFVGLYARAQLPVDETVPLRPRNPYSVSKE